MKITFKSLDVSLEDDKLKDLVKACVISRLNIGEFTHAYWVNANKMTKDSIKAATKMKAYVNSVQARGILSSPTLQNDQRMPRLIEKRNKDAKT